MTFNENARLDPSQVEDRRGAGGRLGGGFGRGFGGGGGGGRGPVIAGGGGISVLLLVAALLLGVNPFEAGVAPATDVSWPQQVGTDPASTAQECQTGGDANQRTDCRVVGFVNSIQDHWRSDFQRRGMEYTPAKTVLFSGSTQAACGFASEAMGPFYCPEDHRVYLDLSFFSDLQGKYGASGGPFAQAYVIAHEYGHHLQNIMGLLPEGASQDRGAQGAAVRVELMADCLAGVWVQNAAQTGYLQPPTEKDVRDALSAAAAVGDDRLQKQATGRVAPDAFTHGSSEQRMTWFETGRRSGNMDQCNTMRGRV